MGAVPAFVSSMPGPFVSAPSDCPFALARHAQKGGLLLRRVGAACLRLRRHASTLPTREGRHGWSSRRECRRRPSSGPVDSCYDPTTGTFLTNDPLGVGAEPEGRPTSANLFAYVGNDPLTYQDPLGLCRITDAEFNADGNITGGTYVFEHNADICDAAYESGGSLCGGDSWKGVYFYDWDPFNTIDWNTDNKGGCEVIQGNGQNFGVWWDTGSSTKSPCAQGAAGVWIVGSLELCWSWSDSFFDGEVQATPNLGLGFAFSVGGEGCVSAADDPEQLRGWGGYGTGTVLGFNGEVAAATPTDVRHEEQLRSCLGYGPGLPSEAHGGGGYTFGFHP